MTSKLESVMTYLTTTLALGLCLLAATPRDGRAQAADIPSAQARTTGTPEQRGRILIDQMIEALGGQHWLDRATIQLEGRGATFFHGAPNLGIIEFREYRQLPVTGQKEAERIEFTKKHDIVHIFTPTAGYEITYKGVEPLPKDQVEDNIRRSAHSIEEVARTWIHAPGVMIVAEGTTMVERRQADKVTILSANNDAVTLELDATTHLPLRRSFEWRNLQFKDHDEDAEEYDDYHTMQGLPTPLTVTRYRNGDMVSQRFITKVTYNAQLASSLFDTSLGLKKK
jgi:hypothetical protein